MTLNIDLSSSATLHLLFWTWNSLIWQGQLTKKIPEILLSPSTMWSGRTPTTAHGVLWGLGIWTQALRFAWQTLIDWDTYLASVNLFKWYITKIFKELLIFLDLNIFALLKKSTKCLYYLISISNLQIYTEHAKLMGEKKTFYP